RWAAEELPERDRRLADQHRQSVDRLEPCGPRGLQQRRVDRMGDDVVDYAPWRCMTEVERQRRLAGHAKRTGVDHEIETPLPVVECEIGRLGKMGDVHRVVLAPRVKLVEQGAG